MKQSQQTAAMFRATRYMGSLVASESVRAKPKIEGFLTRLRTERTAPPRRVLGYSQAIRKAVSYS